MTSAFAEHRLVRLNVDTYPNITAITPEENSVSSTRSVIHPRQAGIAESRELLAAPNGTEASAVDSNYLLDRLSHLRSILPVFAQELAVARHQVTWLQAENGGLQQELLQMQMHASATSRSISDERQP